MGITEQGKLLTLSALDGSVQWGRYFKNNKPKMVAKYKLGDYYAKQYDVNEQIAVLFEDKVEFYNPINGDLQYSEEISGGKDSLFVMY